MLQFFFVFTHRAQAIYVQEFYFIFSKSLMSLLVFFSFFTDNLCSPIENFRFKLKSFKLFLIIPTELLLIFQFLV